MIAYINDLSQFEKVARSLDFYNFEDLANSDNDAFSKSIYIFDNYPIRIRIRVYKNTGLVEVKAFKYCGKYFKEIPRYLNWKNKETYLKCIEKFLVLRKK